MSRARRGAGRPGLSGDRGADARLRPGDLGCGTRTRRSWPRRGGRQLDKGRYTRYSDYNRVTGSLRQPDSAWKPLVYLAAFRQDMNLDSMVPDEPVWVPVGTNRSVKWIANYDKQFKGLITMRHALDESRNAVAVWITREIGLDRVIGTSRELGIRTPLQPYLTTAPGGRVTRHEASLG